ncbi:MAG: hypothetical protein ACPGVH_02435 [Chitinophagales bacterium]
MKTNKNSYINNDGLSFPGILIFVVLALISLIPLISFGHYLETLIPVAIIILSFSSFRYTEVNFETRKYREAYSFFGKRFGEWKKIIDINYVSIVGKNVRTQHQRTLGPINNPTGTSESYGVYEIRLFKSISQRIILYNFSTHKKALKVGKILAKGLETKLLDATKVPPVFVDE